MRVAFYAPMKSPLSAVPSGDRRMGRLLMAALDLAGHEVAIASELRTHLKAADPARQAALIRASADEAARLIAAYQRHPSQRPDVWFTYHVYYKAPDWLGPVMRRELGLPYVAVEVSFAPKRANGPWSIGHEATRVAIAAADAIISPTLLDMACVADLTTPATPHVFLPPFLDHGPFAKAHAERAIHRRHWALNSPADADVPWLLTVAMMREGPKHDSYRVLADALARLDDRPWQLLVAGDGRARADITAAFAPFGKRIVWLGAVAEAELPSLYAAADLYVWPAVHEAYGMALLEAQAAGVPVVAGDVRGVPDVVRRGETALLVPEHSAAAFAAAVAHLLDHHDERHTMGKQALRFVERERTIAAAAAALDKVLRAVARAQPSPPKPGP
ncbi:MAG: glycosyltransferase [Alphaproteobacteria bacterium]|nr:glycosyltransferase [Alphaproteobacteria bacterium]